MRGTQHWRRRRRNVFFVFVCGIYSNRWVHVYDASVSLKLPFFFFAPLQNYWTLWQKMAARWVTVPIGDDRRTPQRTQVLGQKGRAKNLEWPILPKASQRSRWKVCKGEKHLNLCFTCMSLLSASLEMDVLMFCVFFFKAAALHPLILSLICRCSDVQNTAVAMGTLSAWCYTRESRKREIELWIRYQVTAARSNYRPWDRRAKSPSLHGQPLVPQQNDAWVCTQDTSPAFYYAILPVLLHGQRGNHCIPCCVGHNPQERELMP